MKFSSFGVQALLGLVSVAVSSCNFALATEHEDTAAECDNIVDIACEMDSFSILCAALQNAPTVADALKEGPWTIFAPTNDALNQLGEEILTMILQDEDVLNNILLFHAVPDIVSSEELVCTNKIEMANGQDSRTVCRNGIKHQKGGSNARNNMPRIITSDIETCQGLIHVVNQVMLPGRLGFTLPPKPSCKSIAEIVGARSELSFLSDVVRLGGLGPTLSSNETSYTVFAPVDAAFTALGEELIGAVADDLMLIQSTVLYHAIPGEVLFAEDLACGRRYLMANGVESQYICRGENDSFMLGIGNTEDAMPKIISSDIGACNGVVHLIDGVMLPVVA